MSQVAVVTEREVREYPSGSEPVTLLNQFGRRIGTKPVREVTEKDIVASVGLFLFHPDNQDYFCVEYRSERMHTSPSEYSHITGLVTWGDTHDWTMRDETLDEVFHKITPHPNIEIRQVDTYLNIDGFRDLMRLYVGVEREQVPFSNNPREVASSSWENVYDVLERAFDEKDVHTQTLRNSLLRWKEIGEPRF